MEMFILERNRHFNYLKGNFYIFLIFPQVLKLRGSVLSVSLSCGMRAELRSRDTVISIKIGDNARD